MDKPLIHIGVATMGAQLHVAVHTFLSLCALMNDREDCPWHFTWQVVNDKRPVEYARNLLCKTAIESGAVKLWFLDDDMIPPDNAFSMLHVKEADLVTGVAFKFDHENKRAEKASAIKMCSYNYRETDHVFTPLVPSPGSALVPVGGCGTGCLLINREVLEDPRMHLDPHYVGNDGQMHSIEQEADREEWAPALFRTLYKPNGEILRGEDLDFVRRANLLGYRSKVHLGVRFGHVKPIDLNEAVTVVDRVSRMVADDMAAQNTAEHLPAYVAGATRG